MRQNALATESAPRAPLRVLTPPGPIAGFEGGRNGESGMGNANGCVGKETEGKEKKGGECNLRQFASWLFRGIDAPAYTVAFR